jgi:hypothetical protein
METTSSKSNHLISLQPRGQECDSKLASINERNKVESTKLSEEAKNKLLELQAELQQNSNNSENNNYIKFKQGHDFKVLKFEPEKTHTEYVEYPNNPKPTLQYKFYASELIDKKQNRWTKVREWTISPTWARSVISLLLKGFLTLEVTRTGSDRNDTSYNVVPFLE